MKANYIKELLFEQDCVVIPEFGGFIAHYVSAEIHSIRHTFTPPSKSIAFNEMLRLNDGLLASYVSHREGISREEALVNIREFIQALREEIKQKNKYRLEEVGTLFLNHEQKLQFEPDNRVNFLNGSFGLPELLYKPVERGANQLAAAGKTSRNRTKDRSRKTGIGFSWGVGSGRAAKNHPENDPENAPANQHEPDPNEAVYHYEDEGLTREGNAVRPSRFWLLVAVPLTFLLLAASGLFLFFDDGNGSLSSTNPFRTLTLRNPDRRSAVGNAAVPAVVSPAPLSPTEDFPAVDQPTQPIAPESEPSETAVTEKSGSTNPAPESRAAPEETVADNGVPVDKGVPAEVAIATDVPRFYVVVGSFTKRKNAMKLRNKLVKKGMEESRLILPGTESQLHKVSYADFPTFQQAASILGGLKADYQNAWVFKHVR